jgi:hypothetical protein
MNLLLSYLNTLLFAELCTRFTVSWRHYRVKSEVIYEKQRCTINPPYS